VFCFFNSEVKSEIIKIINRKLLQRNPNRNILKVTMVNTEVSCSQIATKNVKLSIRSPKNRNSAKNLSTVSSTRELSSLLANRKSNSLRSQEIEQLFINNLNKKSLTSQITTNENSTNECNNHTASNILTCDLNKLNMKYLGVCDKTQKGSFIRRYLLTPSRGRKHNNFDYKLKRNSSTPSLSFATNTSGSISREMDFFNKRNSSLTRHISFDAKFLYV
jgi:hypothetical protein